MSRVFYNRAGTSIELGREIGRGGEGVIHEIPGNAALCAKLYLKPISGEQLRKLSAMVANPPADPTFSQRKHNSIAWPKDLLFEDSRRIRCLGFLMPRIDVKVFHKALTYLDVESRIRELGGGFTWKYLHVAALNIASSIGAIHERGHCVGDLNESNLLIAPNALISIIDCDSFQVRDLATRELYRCPVGKPEYTAPELQRARYAEVDRTLESDRFALAVLLFQLLMEGTHPYQARGEAVEDLSTTQLKIIKGFFPYAKRIKGVYPPAYAPRFENLDPEIQKLFTRCFVEGHGQPRARPSALEWFECLRRCEAKLRTCPTNSNHVYSPHLRQCPWCERVKEGKKDPFPPSLGRQVNLDDPTKDLASPEERRAYLLGFVQMALADGVLTPQEREYLINLGLALQFRSKQVEDLINEEVKKTGSKQTTTVAPVLVLDKTEFSFQGLPQDSQLAERFTISNQGGGTLAGSLKANKPWILCPGAIDTGKHVQQVEFQVDTHGLPLGFSEVGAIEITSNGGNRQISLSLSVELPEIALRKFKSKLATLAGALGALCGLALYWMAPSPQATKASISLACLSWILGGVVARSGLGCIAMIAALIWFPLSPTPTGTNIASGYLVTVLAWALLFSSAASLTGKWTFKAQARGARVPYPFLAACILQCIGVFGITHFATEPLASASSRPSTYAAEVTGDMVNIRATPSTSGQILERVSKGTVLQIQADSGEWRQVLLNPAGAVGWIHQSFIRRTGVPSTAVGSPPPANSNPVTEPKPAAVATGEAESPPPLPYTDQGACPFEGCVYRDWKVLKETPIKESPDHNATIIFTLQEGQTARAETGFVLTLKPGLAKVVKPVKIGKKQASPGQIVYLMHYAGEGYFLVWFEGEKDNLPVGSEADKDNDSSLVMAEKPETRWWVQIRNTEGQVGWTDQTDNFGNMDALSEMMPATQKPEEFDSVTCRLSLGPSFFPAGGRS